MSVSFIISLLLTVTSVLCQSVSTRETETAGDALSQFILSLARASPRSDFTGQDVESSFSPNDDGYVESLFLLLLSSIIISSIIFLSGIVFIIGRFKFNSFGKIQQTKSYTSKGIWILKILTVISILFSLSFVFIGYTSSAEAGDGFTKFFEIIDKGLNSQIQVSTSAETQLNLLSKYNQTSNMVTSANLSTFRDNIDSAKKQAKDAKALALSFEDDRLYATHSALAGFIIINILMSLSIVLRQSSLSWATFFIGVFLLLPITWIVFGIHLVATVLTDDICFTGNRNESIGVFLSCSKKDTISNLHTISTKCLFTILELINSTSCPSINQCFSQDTAYIIQNMTSISKQNCTATPYTQCAQNTIAAQDYLTVHSGTNHLKTLASCSIVFSSYDNIYENVCTNSLNSYSSMAGVFFVLGIVGLAFIVFAVKGVKRFPYGAQEVAVRRIEMDTFERDDSDSESANIPWWKRSDEEHVSKGAEAMGTIRHQSLHHANYVKCGGRVPTLSQHQWDDLASDSEVSDEEISTAVPLSQEYVHSSPHQSHRTSTSSKRSGRKIKKPSRGESRRSRRSHSSSGTSSSSSSDSSTRSSYSSSSSGTSSSDKESYHRSRSDSYKSEPDSIVADSHQQSPSPPSSYSFKLTAEESKALSDAYAVDTMNTKKYHRRSRSNHSRTPSKDHSDYYSGTSSETGSDSDSGSYTGTDSESG